MCEGRLGGTLSYDAEYRLTSYTLGNSTTSYKYGPQGNRVRKVTPTGTGTCVHDAFGRLGEASLLPVGTGPGLNIRIFRLSRRSTLPG